MFPRTRNSFKFRRVGGGQMNYKDYILHYGVKGMKWGVRKQKDQINSKDRTIKKGTTIQNISSRKFEKKDRHMYGAYTSYDKDAYIDMMGNFMYNGKAYKNELQVKKDIRLPSDKKLVETFKELVKNNPKQVARDMAAAYNDVHIFRTKKAKYYEKKLSKIDDNYTRKGEKLSKEFISNMVSNKAAKSRAEFFGMLIKKGYDGMSDVNDRDPNSGAQDPLIIFNPKKSLGNVRSIKLEKDDLERYYKMFLFSDETKQRRKDLSEVQQSNNLDDILQHYGVKGMKFGVRRQELKTKRLRKKR